MSYLEYNPYSHYRCDKSNSAPLAPTNTQIVGLELEIASVGSYSGLNDAIYDGVLGTEDSPADGIQLEYEAQSNVEFECVFNADSISNVLSRLSELNEYIRGDFANHKECSAHVHVSREWLEDVRGISEIEYYRAAEAIAPFIYTISGRSESTWNRWTRSNVPVFDEDILERFQYIDQAVPNTVSLRPECSEERYELCNCTNENTLEIRGFSNYYDNHEELVECYLLVAAQLIPDIAAAMAGKSYKTNPEPVLELVADFIADHEVLTDMFSLSAWTDYKEKLARIKRQAYLDTIAKYTRAQQHLEEARLNERVPTNAARHILAVLDEVEELSLSSLHLEDLAEDILRLEEQLNKWFKNTIWRL